MDDKELQTIIAEHDGYIKIHNAELYEFEWRNDKHGGTNTLPDYLHSHDAIQRVIEGLTDDETAKFINILASEVLGSTRQGNYRLFSKFEIGFMLKATPHQKCLALARMWGGEGKE